MNESVLDCLVEGYESLIPTLALPDENDRHVLAAAVHARCDAIITFNARDFPAAYVRRFGMDVLSPDEFLCSLFRRDPAAMLRAARACRARLKNPPLSGEEYLAVLDRQKLTAIAAEYRSDVSLI